ncbi:CAP domain-containing protein [Mucidula mucida]|nr:CAP domain-containing protein [Mucidula mucida]
MLTIRVAVALSLFSGVLAGPACSRKHWGTSDCVQRCKTRWGWSGSVMGSDPWGSVMSSSSGSWESTVSEACGSDTVVSSTEGAVSTSTSSATSETTTSSILSTSTPSSSSSSSSILVESSSVASEPSSSPAAFIPVASSTTSTSEFTSFTPETTSSTFFEPASTTSEPSQPPTTTEVPETTEQAPATTTEAPTTTSSSEAAPLASSSDSGSSNNSGSTSQSDIDAYLKGHNDVRAQHGASDLTWSDDLAAAAQQWANNCVFKHSGGTLGPYGENLAAGTGDYSIASVVWKATTQVGCAVASCDGIFDAYSPAGNVIGQFDANVQA